MRIFFVGAVMFSRLTLEKIIEVGGNVIGVATKSASKVNSDHVSLAGLCERESITYKFVKDINAPHIVSWIQDLAPDIIFVFGWSSLIKKELLEIPSMGVLGYHPAELPHNRGRHPIIWSLALGLPQTASTFFFMDEGADSGDVLSQELVPIHADDNASTLYDRLTQVALNQIEAFLPLLERNEFETTAQDHSQANNWRKRGPADGQIDFRMCSDAIHNLVRALDEPYPGAHVEYNDDEIKVWEVEAKAFSQNNIEPGKVIGHGPGSAFLVKTYDGAVLIKKHDFKVIPPLNSYL